MVAPSPAFVLVGVLVFSCTPTNQAKYQPRTLDIMDDMQAFQQRANEARAAIGKPAVSDAPAGPYNPGGISALFVDAQYYESLRSFWLRYIAELADEARQKGRR